VPAIIEHNKNSQNAKKIQTLGFFRCPIILGRNEKKTTFITFPSRLKIPKLPSFFSKHLRKRSHEY
jgi:hypothetical protein